MATKIPERPRPTSAAGPMPPRPADAPRTTAPKAPAEDAVDRREAPRTEPLAPRPAELGPIATALDKVRSGEATLRSGITKLEAEVDTLERDNAARTKQLETLTAQLQIEARRIDDLVFAKTLAGTTLTILTGGLLPLGLAMLSGKMDGRRIDAIEAQVREVRAQRAAVGARITQHRRVCDTLGAKLEQLRVREKALTVAEPPADSGLVGVRLTARALDRSQSLVENLEGQVHLLEEMRDSAKSVGEALAPIVARLDEHITHAKEALSAARSELVALAGVAAGASLSSFARDLVTRLATDELEPIVRAEAHTLVTDLIRTKAHEATTRWVTEHARAVPVLGALPPPGSPRDPAMAPIDAVVGDARVVAVGEAAHGLHEFPAIRNRIFTHLIEHGGFRAVTLESGIVEARLVDRWVCDVGGKSGLELDDVLARGFTHGMGPWEETRELVTWVRAFNERAARRGEPLVRFSGKDLPREGDTLTVPLAETFAFLAAAHVELTEEQAAFRALAERSARVTTRTLDAMEQHGFPRVIDPDLLDAITSISYEQLSVAEREALGRGLEQLRTTLVERRDELVDRHVAACGGSRAESEEEHAWAVEMTRVAGQLLTDIERRVVYPADPFTDQAVQLVERALGAIGEPMPEVNPAKRGRADDPEAVREFFAGRTSRERHLAENVVVMTARHGRALSFTHNGHASRVGMGTRIGGEAVRDRAEGEFLARTLGRDYVVIAATAGRYVDETGGVMGSLAGVPLTPPGPDAIESLFTKLDGPQLVDLRRAPEGPARDWLGAEQKMRHQGTFEPVIPSACFDAILHVPTAAPGHTSAPQRGGAS